MNAQTRDWFKKSAELLMRNAYELNYYAHAFDPNGKFIATGDAEMSPKDDELVSTFENKLKQRGPDFSTNLLDWCVKEQFLLYAVLGLPLNKLESFVRLAVVARGLAEAFNKPEETIDQLVVLDIPAREHLAVLEEFKDHVISTSQQLFGYWTSAAPEVAANARRWLAQIKFASEGGKERSKKYEAQRKQWRLDANQYRAKYPEASKKEIASWIAKKHGGKVETIRKII